MPRALRDDAAGPSPAPTARRGLAESYLAAFPALEVDPDSLIAHLALVRSATIMTRQVEAQIKALGFDLTRPRYTILRMIYLSAEKTLFQTQIAQMMGVSGPYVTQMIDTLEQEGWLERVVQRPNRRFTSIKLTPDGIARCDRLIPALLQYMAELMSDLTPGERQTLTNLVAKLIPTSSRVEESS